MKTGIHFSVKTIKRSALDSFGSLILLGNPPLKPEDFPKEFRYKTFSGSQGPYTH
jgi:hypothetical protein